MLMSNSNNLKLVTIKSKLLKKKLKIFLVANLILEKYLLVLHVPLIWSNGVPSLCPCGNVGKKRFPSRQHCILAVVYYRSYFCVQTYQTPAGFGPVKEAKRKKTLVSCCRKRLMRSHGTPTHRYADHPLPHILPTDSASQLTLSCMWSSQTQFQTSMCIQKMDCSATVAPSLFILLPVTCLWSVWATRTVAITEKVSLGSLHWFCYTAALPWLLRKLFFWLNERILSSTEHEGKKTLSFLGCMSANLCENHHMMNPLFGSQLGELECCGTSFCNSATTVRLSAVPLLLGLTTLLALQNHWLYLEVDDRGGPRK